MTDHGFENGRERPADYIGICENIVGSYPFGPIHGFQKDMLQNNVDARVGRACVEVRIEHVVNSIGEFLVVTDSHTCGLTGPYVRAEDYDEDLPDDYHWARFEGFAFTKSDPDAIGARGQGKFVLLRASADYRMYYDTLRDDGVYRFGGTQATRTGCPILPGDPFAEPWEGNKGREQMVARCGLPLLGQVGTRIIIASPRPEYIEALRSGDMASHIAETWFRALEKRQLQVAIAVDGVETAVGLEDPYPLPAADHDETRVWILGQDFTENRIRLVDGTIYRVKNFHIARLSDPAHEDSQGVAIVQNGMKIEARPMSAAPAGSAARVVGYIEFDTPLERELRKIENQHSNHYSLVWRGRIARAIKAYLDNQMEAFGRAKLGLGRDPRQERQRRQSAAEEAALRQISRLARDLDLLGRRRGIVPPTPPPPPAHKLTGVVIHGFAFPDPDTAPRVERGTEFDGVSVGAYNRDAVAIEAVVTARVLHGDAVIEVLLERQRVTVGRGDSPTWPARLVVDGKYAEAGEYRLSVAMDDAHTGQRIDDVARRFWVDADPPFRAPFQPRQARGFAEPHHRRQWLVSGEVDAATVYYNVLHPAFLAAEQADELEDYLRDIFIEAAVELVLSRPNLEDGTPDFHPLDGVAILPTTQTDAAEVPVRAYREVMRYISDFRWRVAGG